MKGLFSLNFHPVPLWKEVTMSCLHLRCGELHLTFDIFPSLCFLFLLIFFFKAFPYFWHSGCSGLLLYISCHTLHPIPRFRHSFLTFLVVRTFKIYSLSHFQIHNTVLLLLFYNTVLLTIVTVPYVTSAWLFVLISLANPCNLWDLSVLSKD